MLLLVAALIAMSAATSARALDNYAEAQMDNPVVPATTAPAEPSDGVKKTEPATEQTKKSFWTHNRSRMYMTEAGARRQHILRRPARWPQRGWGETRGAAI